MTVPDWNVHLQRLDGVSGAHRFLDALKLSASQALVLRVSHSPSGLHDCLSRIRHAASHAAVSAALAHARYYLLADALALEPATCGSRAALSSLDFHSTLQRCVSLSGLHGCPATGFEKCVCFPTRACEQSGV